MDTAPASMPERLTCTCCGSGVRDTPDENVSHGESPYPHDAGFGLCVECGGDKKAGDIRQRLGWAGTTFYEARFKTLRERLSEPNRRHFDAMPYERKVRIVARLIEKGAMI